MVSLDGRSHLPSTVRQWLGDSREHSEGHTLDDADDNCVLDCDLKNTAGTAECGAVANKPFGTQIPLTAYADTVTKGWGVHPG